MLCDDTWLKAGDKVVADELLLDGGALDAPFPLALALHKPAGYAVTAPDDARCMEPRVYDLLPHRFAARRPALTAIGRLDLAASGLLLMTDDGALTQRVTSPRRGIWCVYEAELARPLEGKEAAAAVRRFRAGSLVLDGDVDPVLPAGLWTLSSTRMRVALSEGCHNQVWRMFATIGHDAVAVTRVAVGGLSLGALPEAEWRALSKDDIDALFSGPTLDEMAETTDMAVCAEDTTDAASPASDTDMDTGVERASDPSVADLPVAWDDAEAVTSVSRAQSVQLKAGGAGGERRMRVDAKQRRRRETLRRMLDGMEACEGGRSSSGSGSSGGGGVYE